MARRRWTQAAVLATATVTVMWAPAAASAATYAVTSTADSGPGSLRSAVILTNAGTGGDTIAIPASAAPYILTSGELALTKPVTISGAGAGSTTISGNSSSRIFNFATEAVAGANVVSGVTLTAGRAAGGGAINSSGGMLSLERVSFTGNVASSSSGGGALKFGGSAMSNDVLTITDSAFTGNSSTGGGGAVSQGGGGGSHDTLTITSSLFAANTAGTDTTGGAVAAGGGGGATDITTITASTFTGNSAPGTAGTGGALTLYAPTVHLTADTIDDNTAANGGGFNGSGAILVNTIIAGNHATASATANCRSPITSGGNNLESGTGCGLLAAGDRPSTDPLLGALQNNGGPTRTQMLAAGSPAIDAANIAVGAPVDQRGVARPQGAAPDIGAVEVAPPAVRTDAATSVTGTSATLTATVQNPSTGAGALRFEYGPTAAYGTQTADQMLSPGAGPTAFGATISGLAPGTVIHFRAVASNPDRSAFGADRTFEVAATAISGPDVVASGGGGPSVGAVQPGGGGAKPGGGIRPGSGSLAPALSGLGLSRKSVIALPGRGASLGLKPQRSTGTTISFTDTLAATTTVSVQRVLAGYRTTSGCAGTRPRAAKKAPKRCLRYVTAGAFTHADTVGVNRLYFTGRVGMRRLSAGNYRVELIARAAGGAASAPVRANFRMVAPPAA